MPNSTASNSRSSDKSMLRQTLASRSRKNGAGRPRRLVLPEPRLRRALARLLERRHHGAHLHVVGIEHHLLAGLAELLHVLVLDAAELRHQHARALPLAVRVPADRADHGL